MHTRESLIKDSRAMNENNDCTVRAFAVVANIPYNDAHRILRNAGRVNRRGFLHTVVLQELAKMGKTWKDVTNYFPCNTVKSIKETKLNDTYLICVHKHILALHKGRVVDWTEDRLHRIKAVYRIQDA